MRVSRAVALITVLLSGGILVAGCGLDTPELPPPEGRRTTTSRTAPPSSSSPVPADESSLYTEPGYEPMAPTVDSPEQSSWGYDQGYPQVDTPEQFTFDAPQDQDMGQYQEVNPAWDQTAGGGNLPVEGTGY